MPWTIKPNSWGRQGQHKQSTTCQVGAQHLLLGNSWLAKDSNGWEIWNECLQNNNKNASFYNIQEGFLAFTLSSQVSFGSALAGQAVVCQPLYLVDLDGFFFHESDQFAFEFMLPPSIRCSSNDSSVHE